jgi:CheY-like chemotaxis protein
VFGFVKQSGGQVDIASTPGAGTTVHLYFPRTLENEVHAEGVIAKPHAVGGDETVLVVEDDHEVRGTVVELLQQFGYTVLKAENGDEALDILKTGARVDLVFTDVVMPGQVKSADLAAWAKAQSPSIPVLFTSGHIRDVISRDGLLTPDVHLLSKPYEPDALMTMIRKVLAASVMSSSPSSVAG